MEEVSIYAPFIIGGIALLVIAGMLLIFIDIARNNNCKK